MLILGNFWRVSYRFVGRISITLTRVVILCPDRDVPLHPHMMLDFLELELGFDARVVSCFMKHTIEFI